MLNPAWSPDGKRIALVTYYRNNPDLYVFDTVSFRLNLLAGLKGINITPAFDPGGTRLAVTQSSDGNPEIYLMNLDGSGRTRLTNSWATDTSPSFSPTAGAWFSAPRGPATPTSSSSTWPPGR